jgi:hypothetical protein
LSFLSFFLSFLFFAGVSGDAVSVERLVMQTMEQQYEEGVVSHCTSKECLAAAAVAGTEGAAAGPDGSAEPSSGPGDSSSLEHFCGGWVGWHCEGAPLRSIFGLMMWSELFPSPPVSAPASPSATPSAASPVADVFQTPYQDAPLDLLTPGGLFFRNRREAIEQKLGWIQAASPEDIIAHLGQVS